MNATTMAMMTRFEAARIIGVRAMQLSEGAVPAVKIENPLLSNDYTYVAACELYNGSLDVCVRREDGLVHVSCMRLPMEVASMIDTRDGQCRAFTR